MSIEGIQQIIEECWKIVRNPEEEEQNKMSALHIALEGNVQLANMLKSMKERYYPAAVDSHEYDYWPYVVS
jgi:hypothetical protein